MKNFILILVISVLAFTVAANSNLPYAGQETREIKALSQQEVADYLNGKGLGYAKTAELNQFPGPSHVLDLAKELNLTKDQTRQTQIIFNAMQAQATALGTQFVEKEQELDQYFVNGTIDASSLKVLLSDIGVLQANIRYVHLSAHLKQKSILSKQQIRMYDQLRGYGSSHKDRHNHSH